MNMRVTAAAMLVLALGGMAMARGNDVDSRVGAAGNRTNTSPAYNLTGQASAKTLADKPATQQAEKYVCPMGCATSDKPGKCPKCGMELKKADKPAHTEHH